MCADIENPVKTKQFFIHPLAGERIRIVELFVALIVGGTCEPNEASLKRSSIRPWAPATTSLSL
jgi:hypothetical protein